jgi:hypothetical protein
MQPTTPLRQTISSRVQPEAITQVQLYAKLDGVTPSAWIAKLIYAEIQRRKAVANA